MHSKPNRKPGSAVTASLLVVALVPFLLGSGPVQFPTVSKLPTRSLASTPLPPKGLPSARKGAPSSRLGNTSSMMQMPMVFPLFLQNQDFDSKLVLTSALLEPIYADVILKTTTGTEITRQRVEFSGHSQRTVDIQSLLMSAVSPATTGSIEVMQQSPELDGTMAILGQLSLTYRASEQPNYVDEEIAMPSAQGSQTLRAVADPGEGSPLVAITNLSEAGQHVAIQCVEDKHGNSSNSVDLLAGETLLAEACSNQTVHGATIESFSSTKFEGSHGPVGISLTTDGMPGSLAAFGLRRHKNGNNESFSAVTFTDPGMLNSSTTIFDGVPVGQADLLQPGNYIPELSLANFSTKDLNVHVQYAQTSGATPTTNEIAAVILPAGTSKSIELANLQGDARLQNSFLVTSNGAPGDVAAKLVSLNDSAKSAVELLGKDAQDSNDGGSNPWSIEEGTESTLLFFNHDKAPQIFNVFVGSADGSLWNKDFKVASMETMAISIRDIVQNQMKDDKGKTLPKTATSGQISWWTVETAAGPGTGRLLQSNRESGVARSFACGCPYRLCNVGFDPAYTVIIENFLGVPLDSLSPVICMYQVGSNCGFKQTGSASSQALSYSWSSSNSAILQINGSSTSSSVSVRGVGVGTATMTGMVSATYFGPPATCTQTGSGPTQVTVKILLGGSNGTDITNTTQNVVVGQQIVLYADYDSSTTVESQSWSVPGTTVGGFNASLTSGGTTPTDFSQQTNTFYWVVPASSQNITFTLQYLNSENSQVQTATAQATFNIAGPTSANVSTQTGQVVITSQPALSFGNFPSSPGIQFTASATPPSGYSNSFEWVQIIGNDTKVVTLNDNTQQTCVPATTPAGGLPFLDTIYPYSTGSSSNDTPETGLDSTQFKELTRNFSATMYLLWTPGTQNSIYVPLGSVGWQWSGDAAYNAGNQTWTLNSSSKNANAFSASATYPTWSRYSDYSSQSCH